MQVVFLTKQHLIESNVQGNDTTAYTDNTAEDLRLKKPNAKTRKSHGIIELGRKDTLLNVFQYYQHDAMVSNDNTSVQTFHHTRPSIDNRKFDVCCEGIINRASTLA